MNKRRVTFESRGVQLVGTLHVPDQPPPRRAIVVTGSWLTVKEQMPAVYAPRLAEAGFAALTFDFTSFGESGGEPREVESATAKAHDIRAAVRYLAALPDVSSVGALPICASAGYAAVAALDEPQIRSIAMVAPWLHDAAIVRAIYGGDAAVEERIAKARAARASFASTGVVDYIAAASNTDASAAMYWEGDALDYYLNPARGRVPSWGARFAVMAWDEWLTFDPIAIAPRLRTPTRLVTGPGTATAGGALQFAAAMTAPHDVTSIEGTQFDFYDNPATVAAATAAAVEHFQRTL